MLAADRRVACGTDLNCLCYDLQPGKLSEPSPGVWVGFAGNLDYGRDVIDDVVRERGGNCWDGNTAAQAIEKARSDKRRERLEFYLRCFTPEKKSAMREESGILWQQEEKKLLKANHWDLTFLIGSVEADGPHLWTIDEDNGLSPRDTLGFVAFGGGWTQSAASLYRRQNLKALDLASVIYSVYEAKRETSDNVAGIGEKTSLVVIQHERGPVWLCREDFRKLDQAFDAMRPCRLTDDAKAYVGMVLDRNGLKG